MDLISSALGPIKAIVWGEQAMGRLGVRLVGNVSPDWLWSRLATAARTNTRETGKGPNSFALAS